LGTGSQGWGDGDDTENQLLTTFEYLGGVSPEEAAIPVVKIKAVLRMLADDGWVMAATRGSHRQFVHPTKLGRVTVAGKDSDDLAPGTFNSI
jgi:predicted RNA binding protein YcfA (HicA-like mRNA interferase family)